MPDGRVRHRSDASSRIGLADLAGVRARDGASDAERAARMHGGMPRLSVKPIHALIIVLLLTCALCASLTMLVSQSLNYAALRSQERTFVMNHDGTSSNADEDGSPSGAGTAGSSEASPSPTPQAADDAGQPAQRTVPGYDAQGRVDLNTASLEQLDGITGVGPTIAQRIIDYRNTIGRFSNVDQLLEVSGIGPKTLERMRDQVVVQ